MACTTFKIGRVDDRAGYRCDEHYPNLIFLATVLRWPVQDVVTVTHADGRVESCPYSREEIFSQNNSAVESVAAFLADHIESGRISIFNVHSRLSLGTSEKRTIIAKLRGLDGRRKGGLARNDGFNYYLGGYELYQAVREAAVPCEDPSDKGHVFHRMVFDAPTEWRLGATVVEADRGRAANEAVAKKAPHTFIAALIRLIAEISKRAAEKGMPFDVTKMPGTKADFRALAIKFDDNLDKAERTFDDYLAGLVRFKQGSRETTYYQELFPEFFQS